MLDDLVRAGLVVVGHGCEVDGGVYFRPADVLGSERPVVLGDGVRVGAGAVIHGGVVLGAGVVVEEHAVVGKPEWGYAVGERYDGSGAPTTIGAGSVVRAGACIYADCSLGENVAVGHNTVVRAEVSIGANSQLAHMVSVERACTLGQFVRSSPLTHLTSGVVAEDRVFFGAGVMTINDKGMQWRELDGALPTLVASRFMHGARIGSGCTVAAGVTVGRGAILGSASFLNRDMPDGAVFFGSPATEKSRRAALGAAPEE